MLFVCLLVGLPLLSLWGLAPRTFTASTYGGSAEPLRWSCCRPSGWHPFTAFCVVSRGICLAPRNAFTCRVSDPATLYANFPIPEALCALKVGLHMHLRLVAVLMGA